MKKYGWLLGLTVVAAGLIAGLGAVAVHRRPVVETAVLQRQTAQQTVSCVGRVEEADGEVLAVAAAGGSVQVRVAIPESRLKQVAVGQTVWVSGAAFEQTRYSGAVVSLGSAAYTLSSGATVVDAVIALDAADETVRCGLSARADICVEHMDNALLVSYDSLWEDDNGQTCVYLLENGRAVRRAVETGAQLADGAVVTAGLREGDTVITNPDDVSGDGMRVRTA